ncbi:hypothetical protein BGC33_08945 [Bathymodiolus thermophilus thioautotrophic gill symbiont]|uniref:Uncharacterized protein n=1 Tax=Bathymodiolus thermophilus thioautotrophic gill symbiont TaxID=2360 RepID=A0A1J5TSZ1_9GAMM|nr:hypothetical protein BGC33_08945 [Bathymodiolus thermophilus thioautotrophic gill symbiont]
MGLTKRQILFIGQWVKIDLWLMFVPNAGAHLVLERRNGYKPFPTVGLAFLKGCCQVRIIYTCCKGLKYYQPCL